MPPTKLVRRNELTRRANRDLTHCSKGTPCRTCRVRAWGWNPRPPNPDPPHPARPRHPASGKWFRKIAQITTILSDIS